MNLDLARFSSDGLSSNSQKARVFSEAWGVENLYCLACSSDVLSGTVNNTKAYDFYCPQCEHRYQLKSGSRLPKTSIPDGAYSSMLESIRSQTVPSLLYLRYSGDLNVTDLFAVPRQFFLESVLVQRKPLAATARRAGWVGCNILWNCFPQDARIPVVADSVPSEKGIIRSKYQALLPFGEQTLLARGWTLEVFRHLRVRYESNFSIEDAYALEPLLAQIYPGNNNIRPKIRQQLQVLRDMGLVVFQGGGTYKWSSSLSLEMIK
jgi:type II restriction enzyme